MPIARKRSCAVQRPFIALRIAACAGAFWLLAPTAQATPTFSATFNINTDLRASLGWSSDLGPQVVGSSGSFLGTGTPVTVSASAVRDGRLISARITQTAPYVLNNDYWAASWTGTLNIPARGFYGLFAAADASGIWDFGVPASQTLYFASVWDITAPTDIHASFDVHGVHTVTPLAHGTGNGSFTIGGYNSIGIPGFPSIPSFTASTHSFDTNAPGQMDFSYQIAFSTTFIDASVFDPPATTVPVPTTIVLLSCGLITLVGISRRRA